MPEVVETIGRPSPFLDEWFSGKAYMFDDAEIIELGWKNTNSFQAAFRYAAKLRGLKARSKTHPHALAIQTFSPEDW